MLDRCDRCGAQAYVATTLDIGLPLTWCAHHFRENEEALLAYTVGTVDLRHALHEVVS